MKLRKIILIIALLTISSIVFAQGISTKGLKGGMNLANIVGDDIMDEADTKIGFVFGGFATYDVNEMISIQPEVLFTMKGMTAEEDDMKLTYNLNYLEIPVLLKVNFPTGGNAGPNIFVGPAIAFNLSSTYTFEYDGEEDDGDLEDVTPVDFGIVVGGGINFGNINIDARYNIGLSSIDDSGAGDPADLKNSVISIMLGFAL